MNSTPSSWPPSPPPTDAEYGTAEYGRADYDVVLPPRQQTDASRVADPARAGNRTRLPAPYDGGPL